MRLTAEQRAQFDEAGYLFLPGCFSADEATVLQSAATERRAVVTILRWMMTDGLAVELHDRIDA